ncbi:exocyst complex component 3-like isoform X2 [Heterodontus francisci]
MPIWKSSLTRLSPTKLYEGSVKLQKEIILGSRMSAGSNPFEEDMSNEMNPFAEDLEQENNPFDEEEEEGANAPESLNESSQSGEATTPKRKGSEKPKTLISPLKKMLGAVKKKGRLPTEEKSEEKKQLFRLPSTLKDQELPWKNQEQKKGHRQSEELSSPVKMGNGLEKEGPVDLESKKRLSFLKRGKAKAEKPELGGESEKQTETVPKVKEPLSVLEINKLIQSRDLAAADCHIIELEEECERVKKQSSEDGSASKDSGRKAKDVALLYAELEKELKKIVAESLSETRVALHLDQLVKAIEEEEKVDQEWASRGGDSDGGRPRELRKKWREAVKESVDKRLQQFEVDSSVGQYLANLKEQTVTDLISVRKNLIDVYPKEYEVFNVYVSSCHEGLSSCLSELGQKELEIQDLYIFLQWCHDVYFREVMGHEDLTAYIRKQQLGPLLPTETVQRLEDKCVSMVKTQITKYMGQELSTEQEKWKQGSETFQSELANRVIQILTEHVEKSAAITQELGAEIARCCLCSLADFLQRFQANVQEFFQSFTVNTASTEQIAPQMIALVNCCPAFSDYIERLKQKVSTGDEEKKEALVSLDKVVRGGNNLLKAKLFQELKPNFSKLLRKKWLQSTESFESIVTTIRNYFNQFRKMKTPPYQDLVNDVHKWVIIQYLTAVMQVRIICNSTEMRTKVAGQLSQESAQFKELFESLDSTMTWLDPAIGHLAEIIKLKDTSSIQMEVGVLVNSYPDICKKQISAVLDLRGDVVPANRQSILETLQDFDSKDSGSIPSRDRALFAEIDLMPDVRCVNLNMTPGSVGCFSMFRRRSSHTR